MPYVTFYKTLPNNPAHSKDDCLDLDMTDDLDDIVYEITEFVGDSVETTWIEAEDFGTLDDDVADAFNDGRMSIEEIHVLAGLIDEHKEAIEGYLDNFTVGVQDLAGEFDPDSVHEYASISEYAREWYASVKSIDTRDELFYSIDWGDAGERLLRDATYYESQNTGTLYIYE